MIRSAISTLPVICKTRSGHLDNYLKPYVIDIASRDEWPEIIGGIRGLDGLDKEGISYESLDNPEIQQIYKTSKRAAGDRNQSKSQTPFSPCRQQLQRF